MIDFHTHILPNVDDGSKDMETSLAMIKKEIADGVDTIVLTPHIKYNDKKFKKKKDIDKIFNEFYTEVSFFNITLLLGSEIYYTDNLLKHLIRNEIKTLNDSSYILIEFNPFYENYDIDNVLFDLSANGFKPIIAHPERYNYMNLERILSYKEQGALIQIDSASLFGFFGKQAKKISHLCFKKNLVDLISSDCHGINVRSPNLKETREFITKKYGTKIAEQVFEINANYIKNEILKIKNFSNK